jgi:hypothetical protein
MSKLREAKERILLEGEDLRIDDEDMAVIRECLPPDGTISGEDLTVLAEMRREARVVCPEFDKLFFPALKNQILADGKVDFMEMFEILRLLYGGGGVDATKLAFLQELRKEAGEVSPEFEAMFKQAMLEK